MTLKDSIEYAFLCKLGGRSHLRQRRGGSRILGGEPSGPAVDGVCGGGGLRLDPRMLARIKRLARSRYLNYQSMIKQWLSERMENELRER
jgi:hypothetical protein